MSLNTILLDSNNKPDLQLPNEKVLFFKKSVGISFKVGGGYPGVVADGISHLEDSGGELWITNHRMIYKTSNKFSQQPVNSLEMPFSGISNLMLNQRIFSPNELAFLLKPNPYPPSSIGFNGVANVVLSFREGGASDAYSIFYYAISNPPESLGKFMVSPAAKQLD